MICVLASVSVLWQAKDPPLSASNLWIEIFLAHNSLISASLLYYYYYYLFTGGVYPGIIHTAVGVTVGGIAGMLLFKSGKGNRAMSVATGVGVAIGSTYERAVAKTAEAANPPK